MLFTALLAWQLGELPSATLAVTWGFAVATVVTMRYFFVAPIVFSTLTTICLSLAAWLSRGA
jgi:hypothetical protein